MTLSGRRAVITGGSQGFGRAVVEAFLAAGADVSFCARDEEAVLAETRRLREAFAGRTVHGAAADVALRAHVDAYLDAALDALGGIDTLVVNAGVYGPMGPIERVDWEAWVQAVAVNLLGAVYTTRRALGALRAAGKRAKILILSGGGATKPMPFVSAYAASKAGLVRYGETLAEELREAGIDVNMIAPGALNTRLLDEVLQAGPGTVGEAFFRSALAQQEAGGTPLGVGAALCVFLASDAANGITGKLVSAPWDPWNRFEAEKHRLDGDLYTLRRIVPEDRGWSW
jgi:NAD(P)-dependent dehydrogenase (short-subunit alcohol dehydrogenase family)